MSKPVTIDGKTYEWASLSEAQRLHLNNLALVDQEIARLNLQLAITQTARATYGAALKDALAKG